MSRGGELIRVSKHLAHYLAYYRFIHKLETRQMAYDLGLSKSTYNEIEQGKRKYIGAETLHKIADWITRG